MQPSSRNLLGIRSWRLGRAENAFDSSFFERNRRAMAWAGHGEAGGSRAIEQLRQVAIGLQTAQIQPEANTGSETCLGVFTQGRPASKPWLSRHQTRLSTG